MPSRSDLESDLEEIDNPGDNGDDYVNTMAYELNGVEPKPGDYAIVRFSSKTTKKFYVSQIVGIVHVENEIKVKCLRCRGGQNLQYRFIWPDVDDDNIVSKDDIVHVLPRPISERRGVVFSSKVFSECE